MREDIDGWIFNSVDVDGKLNKKMRFSVIKGVDDVGINLVSLYPNSRDFRQFR